MASKTLFILGAGARVGKEIAKKFQQEGYAVAVGSRNPGEKDWSDVKVLPVTVDVGDIKSIKSAFATVGEKLGKPSVVVYNGEEAGI
jgi:NAD(P)-dependent dehydrogenase (short-subunit alcohol dehydrogenase family)